MGLLTVLKKTRSNEKSMRLLVLGLDHAGKTSIIKRLKGEDVTTVSPTFGFDIFTLNYLDYNLNIWDIGGQKSLRAYWRNYFEQTDGVVWVVDSSDEDRLEDCKQEFDKLLRKEKLMDATLLILSNKNDLLSSKSVDEISAHLGLELITRKYKIVSCSAITGTGILDGIKWLVDDISSRMFALQ
ncbi:ADP-ribosylation factor-like protein 2 [Schistocerca gregaria]|uniref:ADP-ribosylation factor-like protein 2 n=1 Tax=Schistocerca gregaria TaxID=7010 RepID=UPI00211F2DBD|nr:ADP-ribosylation factor-like protein 2 [Schistocerca gregaria]